MGHYAKIDENLLVTEVMYIDDDSDQFADEYISKILKLDGTWVSAEAPLHHANYASVGFTHYPNFNAFIEPQPFASWTLEHNSFSGEYYWEPPVAYPEDGNEYVWDEPSLSWTPKA